MACAVPRAPPVAQRVRVHGQLRARSRRQRDLGTVATSLRTSRYATLVHMCSMRGERPSTHRRPAQFASAPRRDAVTAAGIVVGCWKGRGAIALRRRPPFRRLKRSTTPGFAKRGQPSRKSSFAPCREHGATLRRFVFQDRVQRMVGAVSQVIDRIDVRAPLAKDGDQRRVAPLRRAMQRGPAVCIRFVDDAGVGGQDLRGPLVVLEQRAAREVGHAATCPHRAHRIGIAARPAGVAVQGHLSEECVGVGGRHGTPIHLFDDAAHIVRVAALDGLGEPGSHVGHRSRYCP